MSSSTAARAGIALARRTAAAAVAPAAAPSTSAAAASSSALSSCRRSAPPALARRGIASTTLRAQLQQEASASSAASGSPAPPQPPAQAGDPARASASTSASTSASASSLAEHSTSSPASSSEWVPPPIPTTFEELRYFKLPESAPLTHGVHVATLTLQTYGPTLHNLENFSVLALRVMGALGIPHSGIARLPKRVSLWTVPKSPFVHKKAQENFERRTHRRAIKMWDANPEVVDRCLVFLRQHALPEVEMKAQLFRYVDLPVVDVSSTSAEELVQSDVQPEASAAPVPAPPAASKEPTKMVSEGTTSAPSA